MKHTAGMENGAIDNWQVQIRKGLLELCILNALHGERAYGYDIVKQLRDVEGLVIGEGTIYPILSRFRSQGLVESTIEDSPDGPPRKYYRMTPHGKRCLTEMNTAWDRIRAGVNTLRTGDKS